MNEGKKQDTESLWIRLVEAMRAGEQEEAERLAAEAERARDDERMEGNDACYRTTGGKDDDAR